MLGPVLALSRAVNTAATAYTVAQIGWKAFKEIRSMQKEKVRACEIRAKFVDEYKRKHEGDEPDEELVQIALSAADAVDRPIRHRVDKFLKSTGEQMQECVDFASEIITSVNERCTKCCSPEVVHEEPEQQES